MAISDAENANNAARLQAVIRRVSRQISIEAMFRAGQILADVYNIPIPPAVVAQQKTDFAELRSEINTLETAINPNE